MQGNNNSTNNQIPRIVTPDSPRSRNNDCLIKGMILNALLDKPAMKSRDIFNSIEYTNYNSFRATLSRFCTPKYRYIERIGNTKPYLYKLTDIGKIHAQNPFYFRDKYKLRQAQDREMFLFELLNNPEKMGYYFGNMDNVQVQTVYDTVLKHVDSNSLRDFGDEDDTHDTSSEDEIDYEEKYYDLQEKIKKLQSENLNLQIRLTQRPEQIHKVQESKLPSTNKSKRYNMLNDWENKKLTAAFFSSELIPFDVLVKVANKDAIQAWKQKLNLESDDKIGIFARTIAATLLKEGLYRRATAEEIKDAGFYLSKNRGIRIVSKKYKAINKIILKQSEIPTNAAVSKNAPQVKIRTDKNPG